MEAETEWRSTKAIKPVNEDFLDLQPHSAPLSHQLQAGERMTPASSGAKEPFSQVQPKSLADH